MYEYSNENNDHNYTNDKQMQTHLWKNSWYVYIPKIDSKYSECHEH